MKMCSDCNVLMIESTNLHTDYVGGVDFETEIYLSIIDNSQTTTGLFGIKKNKEETKRVKARVCPKCGKVELFVDFQSKD